VIDSEAFAVLDRFCAGFANRDAHAVLAVCAPDPNLAVVTSERALLRGPDELRAFLDRYVAGPTRYSWDWDRRDVTISGSVAWLLAEGTETATSESGSERHPYRMTMVLVRRAGRWLITQAHGSSPSVA
jgi:uncharacterized protein (TIGR02246 family)